MTNRLIVEKTIHHLFNFQSPFAINTILSQHNVGVRISFSDAILIILIALLFIIAYVRLSSGKYLHRLSLSILNYSYSNSFFKEKNLGYNFFNFLMLIIYIISSSIFTFILFREYGNSYVESKNIIYLLISVVANSLLILLHHLAYYLLGISLLIRNEVAGYIFFVSNLARIVGMFNTFILLGTYFTENKLHMAFILLNSLIFLIAYILRIYRVLLIFLRNRFSIYYMILYLCGFEIVPILVILKLIISF